MNTMWISIILLGLPISECNAAQQSKNAQTKLEVTDTQATLHQNRTAHWQTVFMNFDGHNPHVERYLVTLASATEPKTQTEYLPMQEQKPSLWQQIACCWRGSK